jgi:hypothetical protein
MILIAELVFPFRREVDLIALYVPLPEADLCASQNPINEFLGFLKRLFRASVGRQITLQHFLSPFQVWSPLVNCSYRCVQYFTP